MLCPPLRLICEASQEFDPQHTSMHVSFGIPKRSIRAHTARSRAVPDCSAFQTFMRTCVTAVRAQLRCLTAALASSGFKAWNSNAFGMAATARTAHYLSNISAANSTVTRVGRCERE